MWNDICYAFRTLRKDTGFTLIAVAALALGIGATTAIFTTVSSVLLRPLPFGDPGRLYRIATAPKNRPNALQALSDPALVALEAQSRAFESIASFNGGVKSLTGAGEPVEVNAPEVTPNFISLLAVNPQIGRTFRPGEEQVTILSDALWRSRFHADRALLGRAIVLDGKPITVIGVMPATFRFPERADLWVPAVLDPGNVHIAFRAVIGRLREGTPPAQAQSELAAIAQRINTENRMAIRESSLRMHRLQDTVVGTKIGRQLGVLLGAVGFLLLIACVNVANLLVARSTRRTQEVALRYSLGATRLRVIRLLLTESAILSLAGGFAGVIVAMWGVAALLKIAPHTAIPRFDEIGVNGEVFAFAFALSIVTAVVFGLWPALQGSNVRLNEALKEGIARMSSRSQGVRNVLVAGEIALAMVLLVGAGLLIKSFLRLRSVDPGFRAHEVFSMGIRLPQTYTTAQSMLEFSGRTEEVLRSLPGVESAAVINYLPMRNDLIMGSFAAQGKPDTATAFNVNKPAVSPGYFHAMGIRLLSGRDFTTADTADTSGVMIVGRETARRVWPNENPIGKRITFADNPKPKDWHTVVGVVDDVKQEDLKEAFPPAIYQPLTQVEGTFFLQSLNFVVRTARPAASVAMAMRRALHQVDPNQPAYDISTMEALLTANTAEPRFYSRLLGAFSFLAFLLAVIGIYGVVAFSVAHRTREIGIRMALGARAGTVLAGVMARSAILAGAGIALGIGGALGLTRLLKSFLFEVEPTDMTAFVLMAAILAAAAMLASYLPARRASRIDPMQALRYE